MSESILLGYGSVETGAQAGIQAARSVERGHMYGFGRSGGRVIGPAPITRQGWTAMRTRKEIERAMVKVDQSRASLEQELASIGAEIRDLEAQASALLTQADTADLRAMARQQAQARVEMEAAQATGAELQRRVAALGEERQKLEAELRALDIEEAQEAAALIAHRIADQLRELVPTVKEYEAAMLEIRRRGGRPTSWFKLASTTWNGLEYKSSPWVRELEGQLRQYERQAAQEVH